MNRTSVVLEDLPDTVAPMNHVGAELGIAITIFIVFL
jgi:hypothetical protein